MSLSSSLSRRADPSRRRIWGPVGGAAVIIATGVVLGTQFLNPNMRVIPVMVAIVMVGIAWRISMAAGLGVLVLALPFTRTLVFANTSFALMLILYAVWLLRAAQGLSAPARRTPLDASIAGFIIAFVISWYNIRTPVAVSTATANTIFMATGVLTFYLIVSNVRTENDLRRLHFFQAISLASIYLLAVWELYNPNGTLIPGVYAVLKHGEASEVYSKNIRVGGPFYDFELFGEFCAINMPFVAFLIVRSASASRRLLYGALLVVNVFVLFAAVTRGAIISLFSGLLYLSWLMRRRIRLIPFTVIVAGVIGGFILMNYLVAQFTPSGDLFERLRGTTFVGGMPDDRRETWIDAWNRFLVHPIIGYGPYYASLIGTHSWGWPHNGYLLVMNMTGLVGLAMFLWLLVGLWIITRPRVDRLDHPSYVRSFMVIAHVQLAVLIVDQLKIDFLRNGIYITMVWLQFAVATAAYMVDRASTPPALQSDA